MNHEFCNAQPGDIVYDIPKPPELRSPTKYFLRIDDKKRIMATNATGNEIAFNPEQFCLTKAESQIKAELEWWYYLKNITHTTFNAIQAHKADKYPS